MWFYFDANALAKRYSQEIGTDLINEIFRQISLSQLTCLSLSILETASILVRKKNDDRLPKPVFDQTMINFHAELIDALEFVPATINEPLVFSALDFIAKHNINSTDAVILRSVLNMKTRLDGAGDKLVLLSSDKRLVKAAKNENVEVFDVEVETLARLQKLIDVAKQQS
jgi:predicted nucleic acid-binding protein